MTDIDKTVEEAFASAMPYECWEKLTDESAKAYSAFCVFRDLDAAYRTIKKAFETADKGSSYKQWCNWSWKFKWSERAAAFDRNNERIKQTQFRKIIEAQTEKQIEVAGQMLDVLGRKLTTMNPEEITANHVPVFLTTADKMQRTIAGLDSENKSEMKQGELSFFTEFEGL